MSKIDFYTEDCTFTYKGKINTRNWINRAITEADKKTGAISIIFCSDDYLININREYLNHDYFTDIITFDYCEEDIISGDLFISIDMVKSNAEKFGVSFYEELHRVVIHGVLHLIGFKDKSNEEAQIMRSQETYWLERY
jgi:rRNA maturation RNase YbeY